MSPEENEQFLKGLAAQVASAAGPAVNAMAETFKRQVVNVELQEEFHPPGMFWRQVVGHPPAYASGALARSVRVNSAKSPGPQSEASVGAYARYAAIQEWGGETWGTHGLMHWVNSGGSWYMPHVTIPQHPYFRPALKVVVNDGSLRRSAVEAFKARMSPYLR